MNSNPPDLTFFTELQQTNPDIQFRLPKNVFGIPPSMASEILSLNDVLYLWKEAERAREYAEDCLSQAISPLKDESSEEEFPEWYLENQFHNAQIAESRATYIFHTLNNAVML